MCLLFLLWWLSTPKKSPTLSSSFFFQSNNYPNLPMISFLFFLPELCRILVGIFLFWFAIPILLHTCSSLDRLNSCSWCQLLHLLCCVCVCDKQKCRSIETDIIKRYIGIVLIGMNCLQKSCPIYTCWIGMNEPM